jgi:hypothetical protein
MARVEMANNDASEHLGARHPENDTLKQRFSDGKIFETGSFSRLPLHLESCGDMN